MKLYPLGLKHRLELLAPLVFLIVVAASPRVSGQTATSSIMPANPTYVDAVTGIVTVPAVAGQAPVTTTITYSIEGGAGTTATVTTGNNYLNFGQLPAGNHRVTFSNPGGVGTFTPPPPVNFR